MKVASDSFQILDETFVSAAHNNKFDSALYYSKDLERLAVKDNGEISELHASVLFYVGEVYRLQDNPFRAYNSYKKSAAIFEILDPNISLLNIYDMTVTRAGFMCGQIGAVEDEKSFFAKALVLNNRFRLDKYIENNEQIYLELGNIFMYKGDYEKADSVFSLIKLTLDSLPPNGYTLYLLASVYANNAIIYSETGNYKKSEKYVKEALQLGDLAKDSGYTDNDYVQICLNLSQLYAYEGNMAAAWEACKQAEDSLTDFHRNISSLQIIKTKAFLYQQQNNFEQAIQLNKEFIKAADTIPNIAADYFSTLGNLGVLYTAIKQYAKADSLFRKDIAFLQDTGLVYSYSMLQAKKGLCINLVKEKKYTEAADSLLQLIQTDFEAMSRNFQSMSEADKMNYQSEADKVFDLLYICMHNRAALTIKNINAIYKAELQRKGAILRNQLAAFSSLRNSTDTATVNLYNAWLNNKEILSNQYSLPYNKRLFKIDSLEQANDYLEKEVTKKARLQSLNSAATSFSLKPVSLSANIEFLRYDYKSLSSYEHNAFYAAFITTSADTFPHFIELCSEQQLINLLKDKKGNQSGEDQLTQKIYDKESSYSPVLYRLIWQKLNKYLTNVTTINYSTSGLLNNIAFPAVFNGKEYLINRFAFNRFFSLQQASANNILQKKQAVNIWGNINYDVTSYQSTSLKSNTSKADKAFTSTVSLAGAVKDISNKPLQSIHTNEVQQLKKLFTDNKVAAYYTENTAATEENFKQQASSFKGILHISTHGFYAPFNKSRSKSALPSDYISSTINPLFRCGLAFAGVNYYWKNGIPHKGHDDGILTGYEISQLDMHNVDLVTLSACETGLGDVTDNEGDLGLQRAFKLAGVRNMLISLWHVPAQQTAELLNLFYSSLLNGKTAAEALRSAELTLQKKYPPYFWAGFVLVQ